MDTFMKEANAQPVSFGEYKVTKTIKGLKTTSVPESTQDFNQFQATTNEVNLDTQFQTTAKEATSADNFNFFQGDSNLDTEEFATVKVIQSNETSSDVNLNQFQTAAATTTNTTETKLEGFDTNAQFDFGNSNTNFETNTTNIVDTNTFNAESATKDLGNFDFNTNTQTQFGEFQTETNLNLGEAFGKTETTTTTNLENIDTNVNYNAETFQSIEPNVDLNAMTNTTPALDTNTNNFDFTSSNSIVGATSALNDFNINTNFAETTPAVDTSSAFKTEAFTTTQTTTTTTTSNVNLTHELVDPNPIQVSTNFANENQFRSWCFYSNYNNRINSSFRCYRFHSRRNFNSAS